MTSRFAIAVALIVALGACGSEKTETTETTAAEPATAQAVPVADDAAAPVPEAAETPDAAATDAATPAPSPSASATPSPAPAPTMAAASGPPDAFKQCAVCHKTTPGDNLIGPSLAGVFGAKSGHVDSFKYSPAMASANLTWNAATLDKYLAEPKAVVPGTTMAFAGVKDDAKRKAIIDYLKTL